MIITTTGWTWDYIDHHMTMTRYNALVKYWNRQPPTHLLVAAYMGVKEEDKPNWKTESIDDLFSRFGMAVQGK